MRQSYVSECPNYRAQSTKGNWSALSWASKVYLPKVMIVDIWLSIEFISVCLFVNEFVPTLFPPVNTRDSLLVAVDTVEQQTNHCNYYPTHCQEVVERNKWGVVGVGDGNWCAIWWNTIWKQRTDHTHRDTYGYCTAARNLHETNTS